MLPPRDEIEALFPAGNLSRRLIRAGREEELLPYLLLVRVLRLADQRSQERRARTAMTNWERGLSSPLPE